MDQEHSLPAATLASVTTACVAARWTRGHADLGARLRGVPGLEQVQFTAARDHYSPQPGRLLDEWGSVVATDFRTWANEQMQELGGARAVWEAHRSRGWKLTYWSREVRYYWCQRGAHPADGVQLAIAADQEYLGGPAFADENWDAPRDKYELLNPKPQIELAQASGVMAHRIGLLQAVDMLVFLRLGQKLHGHMQARGGARSVRVTPSDGSPAYDSTMGREAPEAFRGAWRVQRWFEDWAYSSAGRSGAIAGHSWAFDVRDWISEGGAGGRELGFVPLWSHTRSIAQLRNLQRLSDSALQERLATLDQRTGGIPFHWFFYMLHGNLVTDGVGQRMAEALASGRAKLPEHDRRVLAAWAESRYGF